MQVGAQGAVRTWRTRPFLSFLPKCTTSEVALLLPRVQSPPRRFPTLHALQIPEPASPPARLTCQTAELARPQLVQAKRAVVVDKLWGVRG